MIGDRVKFEEKPSNLRDFGIDAECVSNIPMTTACQKTIEMSVEITSMFSELRGYKCKVMVICFGTDDELS